MWPSCNLSQDELLDKYVATASAHSPPTGGEAGVMTLQAGQRAHRQDLSTTGPWMGYSRVALGAIGSRCKVILRSENRPFGPSLRADGSGESWPLENAGGSSPHVGL
jgi:hypothetical protein